MKNMTVKMNKTENKNKMRKTVKVTSIVVKALLVLGGIALTLFLVWLGLSIYTWLGV